MTRGADRGLKSVWPIQSLRELLSAARHSESLEESPDSVWLVSSPTEQAACFAAAFKVQDGDGAVVGIVIGLRALREGRCDATARENCKDIGPAQGAAENPTP